MNAPAFLPETGSWAPSHKTLLTLQQLGVSKSDLQAIVPEYQAESPSPSESDFKRFVVQRCAVKAEPVITRQADLPINWEPGPGVLRKLEAEGFEKEAIQLHKGSFIMWARTQPSAIRHPDALFEVFCRRRNRKVPKAMPEGWLPSPACMENLSKELGVEVLELIDHVDRFVRSSQFKLSPDWDIEFGGWMSRRL